MNPFFFGTSTRRLFGAYESPVTTQRDHGVVLCPPLGGEYLCSHPTYRLLARQLAAAGHHVLRLDYHGTGDSSGEFEDTDQSQWLSDIHMAIAELKDVGQISRVALVGIRYGGTLAAQVAPRRDDVDQLVLWDAVIDGRAYLDEIGAGVFAPAQIIDASGVGINAQAWHDIASITPDAFGPALPRTLIAVTAPAVDRHQALTERLVRQGVDASLYRMTDVAAWIESPIGALRLPVATLKGVVEWLS